MHLSVSQKKSNEEIGDEYRRAAYGENPGYREFDL